MIALRTWLLALDAEVALVLPLWPDRVGAPCVVGIGDRHSVRVTPAAALAPVLCAGAPAYVLVHTHLDEEPPSDADRAVTRRLTAASAMMGVPLVAHYVLTATAVHDCLRDQGLSRVLN